MALSFKILARIILLLAIWPASTLETFRSGELAYPGSNFISASFSSFNALSIIPQTSDATRCTASHRSSPSLLASSGRANTASPNNLAAEAWRPPKEAVSAPSTFRPNFVTSKVPGSMELALSQKICSASLQRFRRAALMAARLQANGSSTILLLESLVSSFQISRTFSSFFT